MLQIIHIGNALPISYPVHPSAEFEPGLFAQLSVLGNDIMAVVSDGTAPIGIIDDARTNSFSRPQVDEVVVVKVDSDDIDIDDNNMRVNTRDVVGYLEHPSIMRDTFVADVSVMLNPVNGVVTIPAGTQLNYDENEDGVLDSIKLICNYTFQIANKPGDDTTLGSNRVTVYYQRGIYATDQYATGQIYPLNATLFVGLDGKLTTEQPTPDHPGIAVVTGPPHAANVSLQFMLL